MNIQDRPTPETDAECGFFDMETAVSADFARRLEQQRDEAREALVNARTRQAMAIAEVTNEVKRFINDANEILRR